MVAYRLLSLLDTSYIYVLINNNFMGILKSVNILGGPYLLTELSSLKMYSTFKKRCCYRAG